MDGENTRPMTFGEKAVGITFNPAGNEKVQKVKELYAEIIDIMDELKGLAESDTDNAGRARLASIAITEAQGAQMWAVKAITWK
jgi:hypothetical protein